MISVYTDGSSINNGKKNSRGGYAAAYPDAPHESFGRPLPSEGSQTNQTAELTAILEGIRKLKSFSDISGKVVRICTDSEYSINCLTKWVSGWKRKDWKTSEGKPVVHRAILEEILAELEGISHQFVHVKAHTGATDTDSKWNDYVDKMATRAAETQKDVVLPEVSDKVVRTTSNSDEVLSGIPLKLMGPPVSEDDLVKSILEHTGSIDAKFMGTALISALKKTVNARAFDLEKTKIHGKTAYRLIEKSHLTIEKIDT